MQGHDTKIAIAANSSRNVAGDACAVQVQGNQILAVHNTRVDLTIELWIIRDRKNFNGASVKLRAVCISKICPCPILINCEIPLLCKRLAFKCEAS